MLPGPVAADADVRGVTQRNRLGYCFMCPLIQAYFTAHPWQSTPLPFLNLVFRLEPGILSAYAGEFHLLRRHDFAARWVELALLGSLDPVPECLLDQAQFERNLGQGFIRFRPFDRSLLNSAVYSCFGILNIFILCFAYPIPFRLGKRNFEGRSTT